MGATMRAYANYNDFNQMHLGGGTIKINNVNLGFLKGDIVLTCGLTTVVVESGTPQVQVGQIPTEFKLSLKAQLLEITPENYCNSLGVDDSSITEWDGLADEFDYFFTTTLTAQQNLPIGKRGLTSLDTLLLDHGGLVTTDFVVTGALGNSLTAGTDYVYDEINGEIIAIPGGGITTDEELYLKYKCIPAEGTEIMLDPDGLLPGQYPILCSLTDSKTGREVEIYFPKGEISTGGGLTTSGTDVWVIDIQIDSVYDDTEETYPMGYVKFGQDQPA
jgi:hypothetical protein